MLLLLLLLLLLLVKVIYEKENRLVGKDKTVLIEKSCVANHVEAKIIFSLFEFVKRKKNEAKEEMKVRKIEIW